MAKDRLCIFAHVEKCGGTTLIAQSRTRAALAHCDLVMKDPRANAASGDDVARALRAYPALDFLAGHCINPQDLAQHVGIAKARGYAEVITVTTLRPPLVRALSDYVHDVSRRGSTLSFAEYIEIAWKQNYLCRFFGDGDPVRARAVLQRFDCVDAAGGAQIKRVLLAHGFDFARRAVPQTNVFNQTPPSSLNVADGIKIGKYSISAQDRERFDALNREDQALFDWAEGLSQDATLTHANRVPDLDETRSRPLMQRVMRSVIYKPFFARRMGLTVLPRNAVSAEKVQFETASIWSAHADGDGSLDGSIGLVR